MVYKNKMHAWNKHCFTPIQLTCVVHSDKGIDSIYCNIIDRSECNIKRIPLKDDGAVEHSKNPQ